MRGAWKCRREHLRPRNEENADLKDKPALQTEMKGGFFSGYMIAMTTSNSIKVNPLRDMEHLQLGE